MRFTSIYTLLHEVFHWGDNGQNGQSVVKIRIQISSMMSLALFLAPQQAGSAAWHCTAPEYCCFSLTSLKESQNMNVGYCTVILS